MRCNGQIQPSNRTDIDDRCVDLGQNKTPQARTAADVPDADVAAAGRCNLRGERSIGAGVVCWETVIRVESAGGRVGNLPKIVPA